MKVVVFGGAGFLGSHVADALSDAGHEVSVFDLRESGFLRDDQQMIVGDIMDEAAVSAAVEGRDVVYNFAGLADIEEASERPLDTVRLNVLGNTIIIDSAVRAKVKRYVYASTLYIYSTSGSFYRSSKQSSELIIENYHETYDIDFTILRYGSLYGPRADEKNFIRTILKQALKEGRITRHGDGNEIREYVHVLDAAKCSVDILSDKFKNQNVIITGYQQTRIRDLLVMIKEMLQNKIELEFLPPTGSFHYEITPFTFAPKLGKRIVSRSYVDLGQGLLDLLYEIYDETDPHSVQDGLVLQDGLDPPKSKAETKAKEK